MLFFPILSPQRISQKCVYLAQSHGSFWRAAFAFRIWEHEEVQGKRAKIASAMRSRGGAQTEDSQTWWTALDHVHSSEYLFDGVEYIDWRECFVCCRVVQSSGVLSRVGLWLEGKPGCKEKNHFQEQWRVENEETQPTDGVESGIEPRLHWCSQFYHQGAFSSHLPTLEGDPEW